MTGALLATYTALAAERPDAAAIVFRRAPHTGATWTWGDLAERSEQLAPRLLADGGREDGLYAVALADHPDLLPVLLAVWRNRGTALLLDPEWGPRLRDSVLRHATPDVLVTVDPSVEVVRLDVPGPHDLPADAALLAYTSGSTGDPKGVVMTHTRLSTTMHAASAAIVRYRGAAPARVGCSMRLSGSGVLNLHYVWAAMLDATAVVLPELDLGTARDYWPRVEAQGIEQAFLVPPLIALLNHLAAPRPGAVPPPTCLTGSAPLSPATQERFQRRFDVALLNLYGLTESMCASFFGEYDENGLGRNTIGQPAVLKARLRDPDGRVVAGPGEGELELAGPTLFDGYYRNPAATAAAYDGRWFRTGDLVRRDERSRFWITGRLKDVVMKGGHPVYLNEVDEAAVELAGVAEAAAVPLHLPDGREDLGLLVRLLPGAATDAAAVGAELRRQLGPHRSPRRVVEVTEPLPRVGQEKIDRTAALAVWRSLAERVPVGGAS